jgi:predicted DNA-binding transcriptional regulator AlpA
MAMKQQQVASASADAIELITKPELCRRLKASPWTLDRKIRAGEFPKPVWIGPAAPRWRLAEIEAWERDPARRERPRPQQPKARPK